MAETAHSKPGRATDENKVKVVEIAPAARPARMKRRHHVLVISFLIGVVGPVMTAAFYLFTRAADQYASSVGFTARSEQASSAIDLLGGLTTLSTASSSDMDILDKFVRSESLVSALDRELNLRAIFSKPESDPVFSLPGDASPEDLVAYWERMVKVQYDPGSGLMAIQVRAFDPVDARNIAQALLDQSSRMINNLSSIARDDTTRYAREELRMAEDRMRMARTALNSFRNRHRIVDPSADIQGQMGLLNSLQARLADAQIDLDRLGSTTNQHNPRMTQAKRQVEVIRNRIEKERQKFGVGTAPRANTRAAYAALAGQYESLQVDLEFAEKTYVAALSSYDSAVSEARHQTRYLAVYQQPSPAQTALYPDRVTLLFIVALMLFGIWTVAVLIYYSFRDRR